MLLRMREISAVVDDGMWVERHSHGTGAYIHKTQRMRNVLNIYE